MNIGPIKLDSPTVLAPLAGITNLPLRLLAKEHGCGLVCSEMISANGIVRGSVKTLKMLESVSAEKPLSIQIFGSEPQMMAEAAKIVASSGASIVDINFGCSVKKVLKTGSGSALMKDMGLSEAILKAVRNAISLPLTIKIRSGWDTTGNQAIQLSRIAEACGADAIAVHPRTATQRFSGHSDWSIIRAVKSQVRIPVIGNGDITKAVDALTMMRETGCDAVMIGRAAIGNPGIFTQVNALLNGGPLPDIDLDHHFEIMMRYLDASVDYCGEAIACRMMRSRLSWFVKGLPHNSVFRESVKRVSSKSETQMLIREYQARLRDTV